MKNVGMLVIIIISIVYVTTVFAESDMRCGTQEAFGSFNSESSAGIKVTDNTIATPTPKAVNIPKSVMAVRYDPVNERKPISVVSPVKIIGTPTSLRASAMTDFFSAPGCNSSLAFDRKWIP